MPAETLGDECTPEEAVELIRTTPANPTQEGRTGRGEHRDRGEYGDIPNS
jgi:hypothetical protein